MGAEKSKPLQSSSDICPVLFTYNTVKPQEVVVQKPVPLRIKIPQNTIDLTRSSLRSYKSTKNELALYRIDE